MNCPDCGVSLDPFNDLEEDGTYSCIACPWNGVWTGRSMTWAGYDTLALLSDDDEATADG